MSQIDNNFFETDSLTAISEMFVVCNICNMGTKHAHSTRKSQAYWLCYDCASPNWDDFDDYCRSDYYCVACAKYPAITDRDVCLICRDHPLIETDLEGQK